MATTEFVPNQQKTEQVTAHESGCTGNEHAHRGHHYMPNGLQRLYGAFAEH